MSQRYQPRLYRAAQAAEDLVGWRIVIEETDLHVQAERELREASLAAARRRGGRCGGRSRGGRNF
jgi:hypothetical protein